MNLDINTNVRRSYYVFPNKCRYTRRNQRKTFYCNTLFSRIFVLTSHIMSILLCDARDLLWMLFHSFDQSTQRTTNGVFAGFTLWYTVDKAKRSKMFFRRFLFLRKMVQSDRNQSIKKCLMYSIHCIHDLVTLKYTLWFINTNILPVMKVPLKQLILVYENYKIMQLSN